MNYTTWNLKTQFCMCTRARVHACTHTCTHAHTHIPLEGNSVKVCLSLILRVYSHYLKKNTEFLNNLQQQQTSICELRVIGKLWILGHSQNGKPEADNSQSIYRTRVWERAWAPAYWAWEETGKERRRRNEKAQGKTTLWFSWWVSPGFMQFANRFTSRCHFTIN